VTVAVHRDVVFAEPPGFRPLALDLYVPATPAVGLCVYLHGGGWRVGSRRDGPVPGFFRQVAGHGVAVASVDYRLSGEATFPAQAEDVAAALAFLARERDGYAVATDRTYVWGVSAGGHLAALAALSHPGIDAAVCWYTPFDLDALAKDVGDGDRSATSREGALVGAALDERPDLVAAASPVRRIRPGAPPFLLLTGDADRAVPHPQSERFAAALTAAGGRATLELVPGAGHMFSELDEAAARALVDRSAGFLLSVQPGE
jgi:acetyl esterase/lipase